MLCKMQALAAAVFFRSNHNIKIKKKSLNERFNSKTWGIFTANM